MRTAVPAASKPGLPLVARLAVALAGAVLLSAAVATHAQLLLAGSGRPEPWSRLFLRELPVWSGWAALSPAVFALCRRVSFGRGRWPWAVAAHALAAPTCGLLELALVVVGRDLTGSWELAPGATLWTVVGRTYHLALWQMSAHYAVLVGACYAVLHARELRRREGAEARLASDLAEARLLNLDAQLHPHFLFNTLHSISALMAQDVVAARAMLTRLAALLRASLATNRHEVTLGEELSTLDGYVALQAMRFGERLRFEVVAEPEARGLLVPRLLLQPLVENAIRYAVEPRARGGRVRVAAEVAGDSWSLSVGDDGPGFPPAGRTAGVGLRNAAQRLRQLYGTAGRLELANAPEGGALVTVVLPLRRPAEVAAPAVVGSTS